MKNCWDFIKCYWMLLLGVISLAISIGLYMYQYISSSMDIKNDCIFKWSLSLNVIGIIAIAIFIICRYCCKKSDNPTSVIKSYIDNLNLLKREYICTRNKQYIIAIILFLAILSSVLIPYIRNLYKIGFIFSSDFHKSHLNELKTFNIIDMMRQDQLSLFWDSIPLFIIFIILCILLFYIILCIRITSHKISLINSTITKVALYKNNEDYDNNDTPIFSIQSVDDNDLRYYWAIDGKWLTDERGDKIPNQTNGVVTIFKIECGYFKFSTDGGQNWHKANAFEYERNMANIEKRIQLEINRLTQELNADSSRNIWSAIFNSR